MIWDRITILRVLLPNRAQAHEVARRWRSAAQRHPGLTEDLIRLGGVLVLQPFENGEPDVKDTARLAYEAGRRDMALQLLAMMTLSTSKMSDLMENNDD